MYIDKKELLIVLNLQVAFLFLLNYMETGIADDLNPRVVRLKYRYLKAKFRASAR